MNWTVQDLGALGELLGSIAVLLTLVYLAVQTRATRNAMELQTMMAATIPSMEINNAVLGSSQECAGALFKAFNGEDLSDKELQFYRFYIYNHLTALATVFLSPSAPGRQHIVEGYEATIDMWWANPSFTRVFDQGGFANFPAELLRFVEDRRQ